MSLPGITGMHGLVGAGGANPSGFNPATLFSGAINGVWIDPTDITHLWKDKAGTIPVTAHGDLVARADDKSGFGNHMLFESGQEMKYQVVGAQKYLLGDDTGTPDWMVGHIGAPFSPAFTSTWSRVSGFSTVGIVTGTIYGDAGTGSVNMGLGDNGSGQLAMRNGTTGGPGFGYLTNTAYVVTELWNNPAPSQIANDNGAYVSSPSMAGVAPHGVWVGMNNAGGDHSKMKFNGLVMITRTFTSGEIANLRTYYGAQQGRTL